MQAIQNQTPDQVVYRSKFQCEANDCQLIMEAIRRLIEGTWELRDEDLSYAWELLPRVREALSSHIRSEERLLFPNLNAKKRAAHHLDHLCLIEQLKVVQEALESVDSIRFHLALATLVKLLDAHHMVHDSVVAKCEKPDCSCNRENPRLRSLD